MSALDLGRVLILGGWGYVLYVLASIVAQRPGPDYDEDEWDADAWDRGHDHYVDRETGVSL